jgi:hypothetical protein
MIIIMTLSLTVSRKRKMFGIYDFFNDKYKQFKEGIIDSFKYFGVSKEVADKGFGKDWDQIFLRAIEFSINYENGYEEIENKIRYYYVHKENHHMTLEDKKKFLLIVLSPIYDGKTEKQTFN